MSLLTGPGMSPPKYGKGVTGTVTNGDKLLCNRCPLKHEARERERGEMLYKNMRDWKHGRQRTCEKKYNWYLKYMIYVVWAQPYITEYIIIEIQGMDAAIERGSINRLRHGRNHLMNESCNDHNKPQITAWIPTNKIQGLAPYLDPNKVQVQACEYMSWSRTCMNIVWLLANNENH